MKQEIIRLLERAKEDGRTIGDVLVEVRGIAEPVAAQPPTGNTTIPAGWKLVPIEPTHAMIIDGVNAGFDHNDEPYFIYAAMLNAAPAPPAPAASAEPSGCDNLAAELDGVIADVEQGDGFDEVCLKTLKRVRDALLSRYGRHAGETQPVAWVAADTLNSPHPTCISSLAYMSQLDRERGREYVPLYAAPVAAQTADDARDAADPLQGAADWLVKALDKPRPAEIAAHLLIGHNRAERLFDAAIAAQQGEGGAA
ncbi:hypothetical protein [Bordetella hinzii]|uniref:hypothetical protein n=1 Tax=Bordetella hinzii TaxID=103855 RepID=UPI0011514FFD|nr:hypothetical protein [Bordetella hinzii]QDJ40327.1 hypothetical protein CBR70_02965 [Bordetella hinzii]